MIISGAELNSKEKAMFALRALYSRHGFSQYRMSKFEEFDLYARNRDFMDAASIITFTDTDGKLMALKPDVTLSIVKNNRHIGDNIKKLYYTENVYRVSPKTHYFKEIMQIGLECLGKIDDDCICEVIQMAVESLDVISDNAVLDISNLDIISHLIAECNVGKDVEEAIVKCISEKNAHSLAKICRENNISDAKAELIKDLITVYGKPEDVMPKLKTLLLENSEVSEADREVFAKSLDLLQKIVNSVAKDKLREMINIDFSVVSDLKYYNGIIFKGFVQGVPDGVVSGGQYDKLMANMKRKSKAIGFAVYVDALGKLAKLDGEEVVIRG